MAIIEKLKKIDDYRWELPKDDQPGMHVPGIIYDTEDMLEHIAKDASIDQVANAAFLPGIVKASLAMPDIHQGYGPPIGAVVATDVKKNGVISPGAVGFDINCGIRLMTSNLTKDEIRDKVKELVDQLFYTIPTGVGSKGSIKLDAKDERDILDEEAANAFGLFKGQITVMIHSGSRGFGHQVCTDYLVTMGEAVRKYKISLPDRQLACAPINSPEGQDYLAAMG